MRALAALTTKRFQAQFQRRASSLLVNAAGAHIAVDGKTLRGNCDQGTGTKTIHRVSAWLIEADQVLGQVKTSEKFNEITAIPGLLESLNLKETGVTTDAMGCKRAIATQVVEQGGNTCWRASQRGLPHLYHRRNSG